MLPKYHYECVSLSISESLFTQATAEQMYGVALCVILVCVTVYVYTYARTYQRNNLFYNLRLCMSVYVFRIFARGDFTFLLFIISTIAHPLIR